jgi:hypothetical protein
MAHIISQFRVGPFTCKIMLDDCVEPPRGDCNVGKLAVVRNRYVTGDETITAERLEEIRQDDSLVSLPVYCYAHSGVALSTKPFGDRWDSGQVGVIYAPKGTESMTDAQITANLEGEMATLSSYLYGECYGYEVEGPDGETLDSCWGFIGELEYCKQCAMDVAEERTQHRSAFILKEVEAAARFLGVDLNG